MPADDLPASAIVTGGAGFIGSHLLKALLESGVDAIGIDRRHAWNGVAGDAEIIQLDVRDGRALSAVVAERRPDVIFHLAAQASVPASMRAPGDDADTNVVGTLRVAEAARAAGVGRIVFFSTGGALHGQPDELPVAEDTEKRPQSIYGLSKLVAEQYLSMLEVEGGLTVSTLRPANVYGPGQDGDGEAGVVTIFAARMLRDQPVTIFGDGSQFRDYLYVDDVVEAALRASTGPAATCLVGTGDGIRTDQLFEVLASACDYQREPEYGPERPGDIQGITLDSSRASRIWGWRPTVTFDDGIARTVEWLRRDLLSETAP